MTKRFLRRAGLGVVLVALAIIQFVPYGRNHDNPTVRESPAWDSARTEELARRACFDCHSNETRWPAYASVAPFSWIIQRHVSEGREHLNFSEFDREQRHADEAAHELDEGEMPLPGYGLLHPEARLSEAEKLELVRGFRATFGDESKEAEDSEES